MVAVPTATPVTSPPATLAVPEALLLQVPPLTELVNNIVLPVHTVPLIGVMAAGVELTVMSLVAEQPTALV